MNKELIEAMAALGYVAESVKSSKSGEKVTLRLSKGEVEPTSLTGEQINALWVKNNTILFRAISNWNKACEILSNPLERQEETLLLAKKMDRIKAELFRPLSDYSKE